MLANWMFYWGWAGGSTPVKPPPIPPAKSGHGSGKAHSQYQAMTEAEWQDREDRLRANLPATPTPETLEQKKLRLVEEVRRLQLEAAQLASLRDEHAATLAAMRRAASPDELKQAAEAARQMQAALGKLDEHYRSHMISVKSLRFQLLH